jgi:hypothetical protein
MERVRNLLDAIGFEVDVFDEPARNPVGAEIERRITGADCVVVLLGPHERPNEIPHSVLQSARIPASEAEAAYHLGKEVVLVLHEGIQPPIFFSEEVWPHFDFWDTESFLDQYHHTAKRLLELREVIDLPVTDANYTFRRAEIINIIESSEALNIVVNHEAIARQPCGTFDHSIEICDDYTPSAAFGQISASIKQTGGEERQVKLVVKEATEFVYKYHVVVEPKVGSRQSISYRRSFRVRNRFPLSRAELQGRVEEARDYSYPTEVFGSRFYGDSFDVYSRPYCFKLAIHFPWDVKILSHDVVVTDFAGEKNEKLTQKVRDKIRPWDDDTNGRRVLELSVEFPEVNHRYFLLYEPG